MRGLVFDGWLFVILASFGVLRLVRERVGRRSLECEEYNADGELCYE